MPKGNSKGQMLGAYPNLMLCRSEAFACCKHLYLLVLEITFAVNNHNDFAGYINLLFCMSSYSTQPYTNFMIYHF